MKERGKRTMEKETHARFRADMATVGYIVREYRGQYTGPVAVVDREELQDVLQSTAVKVRWDDFIGRTDVVVYPA